MDKTAIINSLRDSNITVEKALATLRSYQKQQKAEKQSVHKVASSSNQLPWQEQFLQELIEMVSALLKVDAKDIDTSIPVADMGLDSLSATEFNNRMRAKFGISLQATAFFECNTLRDFYDYMLRIFGDKLRDRYVLDVEHGRESIAKSEVTVKDEIPVAKEKPVDGEHKSEKTEIKRIETVLKNVSVDPVRKNLDRLWKKAQQEIHNDGEPVNHSDIEFQQMLLKPKNNPVINIATAGEGEPLLLLGGLMNPEGIWYQQVFALAKQYRVIAFNMPGLGQSGINIKQLSIDGIVSSIEYVLNQLNIRHPIDVIGFSFGGMFAQALAYQSPELINSMTLINTSARKPPRANRVELLKAEVGSCPEVLDINGDIDFALAAVYGELSYDFDMRNKLSEISVPTLILSGKDDCYIDRNQSEELAALIPRSKHIAIAGARHFSLLTHAKEVNQHILEFLRLQQISTNEIINRGSESCPPIPNHA